jgi:hypothetical protein
VGDRVGLQPDPRPATHAPRRDRLATSEEFPDLEPDSQLLGPALADVGIDWRPVIWSDEDVDWSAYTRSSSARRGDYFYRAREWADWLDRVEATGVPMLNPLKVVRWNSHKSYLQQLSRRGCRWSTPS